MIEVRVDRYSDGEFDTLGVLSVDGKKQCHTLEDVYRAVKIKHETRIPAGSYRAILHPRSRFQPKYLKLFGPTHAGMILLRKVPNFAGVLIHSGNNHLHTSGCILVGEKVTDHDGARSIGPSRVAYKRVILPIIERMVAGEKCVVRLFDPA